MSSARRPPRTMRPDETPGGAWLTYRYRLGGDVTAEAAGTIKAPSFLTAARRLLARRLAGAIGPGPAYLRLRAAGEEEVLLRVVRADDVDGDGAPQVEVVPTRSYHFDPPAEPDPADESTRGRIMPRITTREAAGMLRDAVAALSARMPTDYGDLVPAASAERTAAVVAKLDAGAEAGAGAAPGTGLTPDDVTTLDSWIRLADSATLHEDPRDS